MQIMRRNLDELIDIPLSVTHVMAAVVQAVLGLHWAMRIRRTVLRMISAPILNMPVGVRGKILCLNLSLEDQLGNNEF